MNNLVFAPTHSKAAPTSMPVTSGVLQRQCACGQHTTAGGQCEECRKKKRLGLQTKFKVNEPGDIYEQEADRIADQVMATPAHLAVSGVPLTIQRFSGGPTGQMETAPACVDQALASPGRPLEPALRQDMEQRFGHDFSRVRVHTDARATESARALSARAYTVGHDVVFAQGQYNPRAQDGRKLVAHELTHTIQQSAFASASVPGHRIAPQRQPAPPPEAEESGAESLFTIFVADESKRRDKRFARREAQADAARIRKSGTLSVEDRQLVRAKLRFFDGDAWQIYSDTVRPALVQVTQEEIQMEGDEPAKPTLKPWDLTERFNKLREHPEYIDNNITLVSYFGAELAHIHYKDGSIFKLGLVPRWMEPPVVEVDYHTPAEEIRKVEDPTTQRFGFVIESEMAEAPLTMPYRDVLKTYAHYVDFSVGAFEGTVRIVPSRINMLTAPTLCRALLESEGKYEELVGLAVEIGLVGTETIGAYSGQGGLPKGLGVGLGRTVATRVVLSQTGRKLAREMDSLLASGGTKDITVEGVDLLGVEVSKKGSVLAVRRYMSILPRELRGQGTGMRVTAEFEKAAAQIGRLNGAKTVTIDVGVIVNETWKKLLEGRGYVEISPGKWVKTIKL